MSRLQPGLTSRLAAALLLASCAGPQDDAAPADLPPAAPDDELPTCDTHLVPGDAWSVCLFAGRGHGAPFAGSEIWPELDWHPASPNESFPSGVYFEARRQLDLPPGTYTMVVARDGEVVVDLDADRSFELEKWGAPAERTVAQTITITGPTPIWVAFRNPRGTGYLSLRFDPVEPQTPTDVPDSNVPPTGSVDPAPPVDDPAGDAEVPENTEDPPPDDVTVPDETLEDPPDDAAPPEDPIEESPADAAPPDAVIEDPEPPSAPEPDDVPAPADDPPPDPPAAPAAPARCDEGSFPTNAWNVCLYASENTRDHFVAARRWNRVDADWGTGAPPSLPANGFSVAARLKPTFAAGDYVFHAISDDGVRIDVGANGSLELDDWANHTARERKSKPIRLRGAVKVLVRFHEHTGQARLKVWWTRYVPPPPPPPAPAGLPACAHHGLLVWGLHPDASDRLRCAGITSANEISQTIGNASASAGTHAQDGTAQGHPYSAATDLRVGGQSHANIRALVDRLADQGFAAFARIPGQDGWPSSEAIHVHAIYVGCHMKTALQAQVRDWLNGRNGLTSHAHTAFWQPDATQKARVRALFNAHN